MGGWGGQAHDPLSGRLAAGSAEGVANCRKPQLQSSSVNDFNAYYSATPATTLRVIGD